MSQANDSNNHIVETLERIRILLQQDPTLSQRGNSPVTVNPYDQPPLYSSLEHPGDIITITGDQSASETDSLPKLETENHSESTEEDVSLSLGALREILRRPPDIRCEHPEGYRVPQDRDGRTPLISVSWHCIHIPVLELEGSFASPWLRQYIFSICIALSVAYFLAFLI